MNAYTSKEELALHPAVRISFGEHYTADRARRQSLWTRIAGFFQRHATMNELRQLTDRELADIGLHRGELDRVFQPGFLAARAR